MLASDAFGQIRGGTPNELRKAVRRTLLAAHPRGLRLLARPTTYAVWDGLMPDTVADRHAYRDFHDIDRDHDAFRGCFEQEYGDRMPASWRAALARPACFFDNYVRDCNAVWNVFRPRLGELGPILDHEAQRVDAATRRGTLVELLASVIPGARIVGNTLAMPARRTLRLTVAPDGLTVGPVLTGVRARCFVTRPGTTQLTSLRYPVPPPVGPDGGSPPVGRPANGSPPGPGSPGFAGPTAPGAPLGPPGVAVPAPRTGGSAPDSLVALLGLPRTTLLRHLDRPATAGRLAELLDTTPSGVTYHVDALEAAGLARRHRSGRFVLTARTPRGDALLNLYA